MRGLIPLIAIIGCGGGGGGGGGNGGDAGGGDGGGSGDAPVATKFGSVFIQSYTAMQPPGTTIHGGAASASFLSTGGPCTRSTMGMCEIDNCSGGATTPVSAGTVTISGAMRAISLTPAADHTYMELSTQTALFGAGDTLTFSASGADVPTFTQNLTAIGQVTITAPVKPSAATMTVMRAQDLTVSWTGGGTTGQVMVALLPGSTTGMSLYCRFPASAGQGAVPALALQHLAAGNGAFAMAAISDSGTTAGEWAILLEAYANALWPDGSIVSGPTMVQ